MKYKELLIATFAALTSCISVREPFFVQEEGVQKQKQKISHLYKKLALAEEEKRNAEMDAKQLTHEINIAKLALIRAQIDAYEKGKDKNFTLFMEEREVLYQLIQEEVPSQALEAQVELDRILRIITELSDEEKRIY